MKRIFTAVAMAAAALATLGLAGPSLASAGTSSQATAAHIGKTYSEGRAGYQMIGNGSRFRYIETTVTVPANNRWSGASLTLEGKQGSIWFTSYGSHLGYWCSWWDYDGNELELSPLPQAGDRLNLSIYVDRHAGKFSVAAVDLTTGASNGASMPLKALDYTRASVTGGGAKSALATTPTRIWAFQDTKLTAVGGYHGTILGPWATNRVIGTRGGTPTGNVVLWPTYPWNNGHNFSVIWRAAS